MLSLLRRLPLEGAVRLGIVGTVFDVAAGSSWSPSVRSVAGPLRWVLLGALCVLALAYAATGRRRPLAGVHVLGAGLLAVAAASTLWSPVPRTTAARTVAWGTVIVIAAALALAAGRRDRTANGILVAVLCGAATVALAGLGILVVSPHDAVQSATLTTPTRYRGLGQNPNTVAMLFAVAMPIGAWGALTSRGLRRRASIAALLLLGGSIVASGSRAAIVAGFATTAAPALAASRTRRRAVLSLLVCAAALAAGVGIAAVPGPNARARASDSPSTSPCTQRDAECVLRLEDEIGSPSGGRYEPPRRRSLFGSSGREQAWRGAIGQAIERPLLGYGFGTESRVFVDRYYLFQGGVPENSYIGMFLQLGAAGVVVFLGLLASLVLAAGRALVPSDPGARVLAATCAGVLVVGLALALSQSYLYAAGNNATLSVWICSFLLTALAGR